MAQPFGVLPQSGGAPVAAKYVDGQLRIPTRPSTLALTRMASPVGLRNHHFPPDLRMHVWIIKSNGREVAGSSISEPLVEPGLADQRRGKRPCRSPIFSPADTLRWCRSTADRTIRPGGAGIDVITARERPELPTS